MSLSRGAVGVCVFVQSNARRSSESKRGGSTARRHMYKGERVTMTKVLESTRLRNRIGKIKVMFFCMRNWFDRLDAANG